MFTVCEMKGRGTKVFGYLGKPKNLKSGLFSYYTCVNQQMFCQAPLQQKNTHKTQVSRSKEIKEGVFRLPATCCETP